MGSEKLTLVTFNAGLLQYRLFGLKFFKNPPYTETRLAHIPFALKTTQADIIALQECFEESHFHFIYRHVHTVYPYYARSPSGPRSGTLIAMHNGLLILSKYPIISSTFHPFKSSTWTETLLGSKGVLEAHVQILGIGGVAVFNVHMASGTRNGESPALDKIRAEECLEVIEYVQLARTLGFCPIILGDFNASPTISPTSYHRLRIAHWEDLYLTGRWQHLMRKGKTVLPLSKHRNEEKKNLEPAPFLSPGSATLESESLFRFYTSLCPRVQNVCEERSKSDPREVGETMTWDPQNSLNKYGPHSRCRGLRCDHIFLPPLSERGNLSKFVPTEGLVIFDEPRVLIYRGYNSRNGLEPLVPELVTLSDHYGVRVILSKVEDPCKFYSELPALQINPEISLGSGEISYLNSEDDISESRAFLTTASGSLIGSSGFQNVSTCTVPTSRWQRRNSKADHFGTPRTFFRMANVRNPGGDTELPRGGDDEADHNHAADVNDNSPTPSQPRRQRQFDTEARIRHHR